MSKFPTIPEFTNSQEDMSAALRAIKQVVEQLAGLRQGESKGAPQVFVQSTAPSAALAISYKVGDFWINTSSNTLNYWSGNVWQPFSYT
jgi:hypothetical protein